MKIRDITSGRALIKIVLIFTTAAFFFLQIAVDHASALSSEKDRGRKEYWLNKYGELEKSTVSKRASNVFESVLAAADRRAGIEPGLYIIDYDGKPWAQSLADGSVIITKKALDFCYSGRSPEEGDSRFAFVVGHELAHQFNGDFWHYKFLRTADSDKSARTFQDIKDIAKKPETLLAKEIQADQYGIIYSALAGYGSEAIISNDRNFFVEWARRESPGVKPDKDFRAFSKKRVKAVSMRLSEAADSIMLFQMGVISYHIGRYDDALALFDRFSSYFPGREVYSNIGTIYLRMAYDKFLASRSNESFPFLLSFGIDLKTRAETIDISRGFTEDRYKEYKKLIRSAVRNLEKAIEYDPFYLEAKNSLGCAYLLENKYYDAVSVLEEALNAAPENMDVQNNLSVAYILLGQKIRSADLRSKAKKILASIKAADSTAGSNWNAAFYQESGPFAVTANDNMFDDMFMAAPVIDFEPDSGMQTGKTIQDRSGLKIVDDFTGSSGGNMKVFAVNERKLLLLVRGDRIRLLLYKAPAGIRTNIKGGEETRVVLSGRERSGIMLQKNKIPDYFEF